MRVVVLGVGNILMSDEGVGVHAVTALAERYDFPENVEIIDGGTSGMDCLDRIADDEINAWFKTKISPHQVGLSDVLAACCFHGMSPKKVVLVGVQPESFETSMELTPKIAAVLDQVIERLLAEIAEMGVTAQPKAA